MSGGHFYYEQSRIRDIADEVERLIEWNPRVGYRFSEETITEFKKGLEILRKAYIYAQRIDWVVSGDDSEESFHKRLKEELNLN